MPLHVLHPAEHCFNVTVVVVSTVTEFMKYPHAGVVHFSGADEDSVQVKQLSAQLAPLGGGLVHPADVHSRHPSAHATQAESPL